MCVCVAYIRKRAYTPAHAQMCVCIYVHMYAHIMYAYKYLCVYVSTCLSMYVCTYVRIYIYAERIPAFQGRRKGDIKPVLQRPYHALI